MTDISRRSVLAGTAAAGAIALPTVVTAAAPRELKMVTSWPKRLPGPGISAERLAESIGLLSGGKLSVRIFAAGELVPALGVFDAVETGAADMAHTASFFWQGKMSASAFFTAAPFGMTPTEHAAWLYAGGGQELWDRLYQPFGLKPFLAGNSGPSMGGWFKKEINGLDDMAGLKVRFPGLGGKVLAKLGATPILLPPPEIFPSLMSGVIDGAEFLGPWSDRAMGFYKAAPFYYGPGWHEPNGAGELIVSRAVLDELGPELASVIEIACVAEHARALAEVEWRNAATLEKLQAENGVKVREFPAEILGAARAAAIDVRGAFAAQDGITGEIGRAYEAALQNAAAWNATSSAPFLKARAEG